MGYGSWHSDPVKAQEYIHALDDALQTLVANEPLSAFDAERIFPGLFRILCDEESEFDFDDAWDTLAHLGPRHAAAVPVLINTLMAGSTTGCCDSVMDYAKEALRKIDREGIHVREYLTPRLQDPDPKIRQQATATLTVLERRPLERRPMKSFRLYIG